MLPPTLPLFPLPNVVLFPTVFLPLHIFEDRYREMVRDALDGDRLIGMTLLRPGWEEEYEGQPGIYTVGCAGLISHAEPLADGRYNIILRGLERFRVTREGAGRAYRLADVDWLPDQVDGADREALQHERHRLEALLAPLAEGASPRVPADLPDEHLVNALSQYLELEAVERQALLEQDNLLQRCRSLIELIEMKRIASRLPSPAARSRH
jgi:hypothetical protein